MACHTAVAAVDLPVLIKQVDAGVLRIENFHVCLPQRTDRSNILPVAIEMISIHLAAVAQQVRNNVVTEIIFRVRISVILKQVFL